MADKRPSLPRELRTWRNAVIATFAVGGVTVSAWGPRLPTISADVGLDATTIGFLLTAMAIGSVLGLAVSAQVSMRLGGRRAIAAALVVVVLSMVALGIGVGAASVPLIAIAFILTGLGISVLDVTANVEGAEVEKRAARTWMPMMHAAWSIGVAAGAALGGLCAAIGVTPAAQFLGEAVIIAIAAVPIARGIPTGNHAAPKPAADGTKQRVNWRAVLDWRLVLIGVVMLGVEVGEGSANNWLSLAVSDGHGQSATVAAFFFTVFAMVEAATRIFAGPVIDRIGRVRAVRYTTALGIVGVILFIVGGPAWVVLVGVTLWAVGVSMGFPLGMSAAATGPYAALRVSFVAAIGYLANFAGPPVIGVLADQYGLLEALWVVVALLAVACVAASGLAPARGSRDGHVDAATGVEAGAAVVAPHVDGEPGTGPTGTTSRG